MELIIGLKSLLFICLLCAFLVFVAMCCDLVSGIRKAKLRGETRTSYGLSRSVNKFLLYEGAVIVGSCISIIAALAHFWSVIGFPNLDGIPVMCCVVSIFICVVELLSLKEKAEDKQRRKMNQLGNAISNGLQSDGNFANKLSVILQALSEYDQQQEKMEEKSTLSKRHQRRSNTNNNK